MKLNTMDDIKASGFEGFVTTLNLMKSRCTEINSTQGIYLVLNNSDQDLQFLSENVGGHFKGRNPTVSVQKLIQKAGYKSPVVYIGKAGGMTSRATLQKRIRQYMRFGQGEPVGHWGGRYIWQLENHMDLIVCWKTTIQEPRDVEKQLIHQFEKEFGMFPFANISR